GGRCAPGKLEPFECGKDPSAVSEGRFPIKFSTVAILFILFDIELFFLWLWAMLFRRLGWFGFVEMMIFLGILMLGYLYIWRKGGLEWEKAASSRRGSTRPTAGAASTPSSPHRS